jgi:hypothetical protein
MLPLYSCALVARALLSSFFFFLFYASLPFLYISLDGSETSMSDKIRETNVNKEEIKSVF